MKTLKILTVIAGLVALVVVPTIALAQYENGEGNAGGGGTFSLLGGVQGINKNRTALGNTPFINIPVAAALGYNITPMWSLQGEVSWMIPVKKNVDVPGFGTVSRKTPNILSYQANALAHLPFGSSSFAPYVVGGVGAMSFLKATGSDRQPQLAKTYTPFAVNFGVGTMIGLKSASSWGLQADLREFAAFPTKSMVGLSDGNSRNTLWMERATLGLAYRF